MIQKAASDTRASATTRTEGSLMQSSSLSGGNHTNRRRRVTPDDGGELRLAGCGEHRRPVAASSAPGR